MLELTRPEAIAQLRHFNRFYTQQIGVLEEHLLDSPFSLTEARVLYELGQGATTTATELGANLGLDAGYLSRILREFQQQGLLDKRPSHRDGRQLLLQLTGRGRAAFDQLDASSHHAIALLLDRLAPTAQRDLLAAMGTIERLLAGQAAAAIPYLLRPPAPGDMGWVVGRHGALYAAEYGWDESFEALVATIVAGFVQNFDAKRERCWIAERAGANVGSVFLVKGSDKVAKLRLLLVEPSARGLGIGARLVDECIRFARQAGYRELTLWTNSVLSAARHIYARAGFQLVQSGPHHSFGHDLVEETWVLKL